MVGFETICLDDAFSTCLHTYIYLMRKCVRESARQFKLLARQFKLLARWFKLLARQFFELARLFAQPEFRKWRNRGADVLYCEGFGVSLPKIAEYIHVIFLAREQAFQEHSLDRTGAVGQLHHSHDYSALCDSGIGQGRVWQRVVCTDADYLPYAHRDLRLRIFCHAGRGPQPRAQRCAAHDFLDRREEPVAALRAYHAHFAGALCRDATSARESVALFGGSDD